MQVKDLIQLKGKKFAIDTETTGLDLLDITGKGIYAFLAGEDLWYVGSTLESFGKRWNRHLSALRRGNHDNKWLQRVWSKHGKIYALILEESDSNLPDKEQYWIDWFRNNGDKVCNMQPANQSRKGIPHTEETKIKIRNSRKGRKLSEETKNKISEHHKAAGIKPPGTKGLKVPALRGNKNAKGNKLSRETKAKIGKAAEGNQYARGHKHSEEQKMKISEASKRMWEERRKNGN